MTHDFDPGYANEPFRSLVANYPDADVYTPDAFRSEWGPIFHRGRLDGTARVLVLGQDPAAAESITRRVLCGAAGQRMQGFLLKLNCDENYVCMNTFLYSVYGSHGSAHVKDKRIVDYRNEWIDAICTTSTIDAIIALGDLADTAHALWAEATAVSPKPNYVHMLHPTYPDSAAASGTITKAEAFKKLCENWNEALAALAPIVTGAPAHPAKYGVTLQAGDYGEIPERDLPAGLPAWMRSKAGWAKRTGTTEATKRATITVKVTAEGMA
jgi:hypothetical protein